MSKYTERQKEAARELLARRKARNNFADFCRYVAPDEPPAAHHLLICDTADKIITGDCNRTIILMPPGSAKSTYATVRFPAYYLARLKNKGVICASYNDTLATQFGKKTRNLVRQKETQVLFPNLALTADSQAKGEWDTDEGGFYFSVGIGGGVTGRRADLGIIDDPIRGRKDADSETVRNNCWNWYIDDFRTRLKPGASIVIILTRWHQDDLVGRILGESWDGESGLIKSVDGEQWNVICLPAQAQDDDILGRKKGEWLWPEWFGNEWWEQTKKTVMQTGSRSWNSLYMQTPADEAGSFFKREWFNRYRIGEEPATNNYQSTDFATKDEAGDYTELGVFGLDKDHNLWLKDWWYKQSSTDKWIVAQIEQYKKHKCFATFGEGGQIRRSVEPFQLMMSKKLKAYMRTVWINRDANKASMARAFQGMASSGMVNIPRCEWGDRLIDQLCKFPNGKDDDAVDVCALMALAIQSANPAILNTVPKKIQQNRHDYNRSSAESRSWKTN